jgi:hypothetical protein
VDCTAPERLAVYGKLIQYDMVTVREIYVKTAGWIINPNFGYVWQGI